jgi:phage gp16-like protein
MSASISTVKRSPGAGLTRNDLLARIHCLKKEACWDDDTYRDILQAKTGERSAKALDFKGLSRAVAMVAEEVRRLSRDGRKAGATGPAKAPAARNPWAFIDTAAADKQPLLRKICAISRDLGKSQAWAEGAAKRQCGGIDRKLEMMSYAELYRLAQALTNTQRHQQQKGAAADAAAGAADTDNATTDQEETV